MATPIPGAPAHLQQGAPHGGVLLLLFKGRGDFLDYLIRLRTRSPYSHCEIMLPGGLCYTSHQMRGGVACIPRTLNDQWDVVPLHSLTAEQVVAHYEKTKHHGYNWIGVIGCAIGISLPWPNRWHCSQWCATVLGMRSTAGMSPGDVNRVLKRESTPSRPAARHDIQEVV